jgi:hypothetical protein
MQNRQVALTHFHNVGLDFFSVHEIPTDSDGLINTKRNKDG